MFDLLNDIVDVVAFRKFLTKGQKWFFAFFYLIIGSILLVGKMILSGVKSSRSFSAYWQAGIINKQENDAAWPRSVG